ncbi:MAG TPA: vitamin K epoxide reductase family protein [Micromonosporaceae bacterium]|nr:vitamin K epoxide reductase family protein [Micromonosporaceae bacterium]
MTRAARAAAGGGAWPRVPRWLPATTTGLALAGLAVSGYLTVEHFTATTTLACPANGVINCERVTSSAQSALLGIPVALLGLLYFAVLVPACLPAAWRSRRPAIRWARLALAVLGVGFVFYLVYTELFLLDAICLWCTAVHAIAIALFAAVAWGTAVLPPPDPGP